MKRRHARLALRVDPVACDGYGHCRELAPELVELDEWGYPIIENIAVEHRDDRAHSMRLAVKGCPRQALWIEHLEG